MGLFNRKKQQDGPEERQDKATEERHDGRQLEKELLESRVEEILKRISQKNQELSGVTSRLADVKKEYDAAVSDLMSVKRETNEEKNRIESLQRQQRVARSKIDDIQKQYRQEEAKIGEVEKAKASLEQIRKDIELGNKSHTKIQGQISYAQAQLNEINVKRIKAEDEYRQILEKADGARAKVREKAGKKPRAEGRGDEAPKNVVEAASAVVASMKTKLGIAQKELEAVKRLLAKERSEHQKTREELDRLREKP